jgi:4-diphosphocytidyl-2-C-methyl-D-erythritol kinase
MNELWGLETKHDELHRLAAELGSDVPYFLREGTAYATGRGELLEYFALRLPYWIVVMYPNIHVSTAWAYEQVSIETSKHKEMLRDDLLDNLHDGEKLRHLIRNDFEPVVFREHPQLAEIKQHYYEHGALLAKMSGSGSSMYGLFESERSARSMCETFEGKGQIFLTRPALSL